MIDKAPRFEHLSPEFLPIWEELFKLLPEQSLAPGVLSVSNQHEDF